MAKVRMVADISGTRDGVDWPRRGEVLEVSDEEAKDLITARLAVDHKEKVEAAEPGPVTSAAMDTTPAKRSK